MDDLTRAMLGHVDPREPIDLAGIPCLLYGPATLRGNADEDDACVPRR